MLKKMAAKCQEQAKKNCSTKSKILRRVSGDKAACILNETQDKGSPLLFNIILIVL